MSYYKEPRDIREPKVNLLTPEDFQTIFGCGIKQARDLFKVVGFPTTKIGRRYYVEENAFLQWLEQNRGITVFLSDKGTLQ